MPHARVRIEAHARYAAAVWPVAYNNFVHVHWIYYIMSLIPIAVGLVMIGIIIMMPLPPSLPPRWNSVTIQFMAIYGPHYDVMDALESMDLKERVWVMGNRTIEATAFIIKCLVGLPMVIVVSFYYARLPFTELANGMIEITLNMGCLTEELVFFLFLVVLDILNSVSSLYKNII